MTDEEKKEKIRLYKREWCKKYYSTPEGKVASYRRNHTPAAKARMKRYRQSEKGKLTMKRSNATEWMRKSKKKYKKSDKGIISEAKFNSSEKSRLIKNRFTSTPRGRFANYKSAATSRKYVFELSFDQFMKYWQKPCSYCGEPIKSIGLDRVDNSIGYTISNVVPCCRSCNVAKMTDSLAEYKDRCCRVAKINFSHPTA